MIKKVNLFVCRSKVDGYYRHINSNDGIVIDNWGTDEIEEATLFTESETVSILIKDLILSEDKEEDFEFVPVEITYKVGKKGVGS